MKNKELISIKEVRSDLSKCYIDPDDISIAQQFYTTTKVLEQNKLKRLNSKKKKHLNTKLSKDKWCTKSTNEVFWENKNEIQTARKGVGFNQIKINVRNCLSCGIKFESEGTHNRVCDDCRKENGFK